MALNLDVDEVESFSNMMRGAHADIMRGRTMEESWQDIKDQNPTFKEIVKEAQTRGDLFASILMAALGISRVVCSLARISAPTPVEKSDATNATAASVKKGQVSSSSSLSLMCSLDEAALLCTVVESYICLYSATPVPTKALWMTQLQQVMQQHHETVALGQQGKASSSPVDQYFLQLRCRCGDTAIEELPTADVEDGSNVEEDLRALLRCCVALGRRATRQVTGAQLDSTREMMKVITDYLGSTTLEW